MNKKLSVHYGKTFEETISWLKEHYNLTDEDIKRGRAFLEDLEVISKKHNVSISHEDGHGAFLLDDYDENNLSWVFNACGGAYLDRE